MAPTPDTMTSLPMPLLDDTMTPQREAAEATTTAAMTDVAAADHVGIDHTPVMKAALALEEKVDASLESRRLWALSVSEASSQLLRAKRIDLGPSLVIVAVEVVPEAIHPIALIKADVPSLEARSRYLKPSRLLSSPAPVRLLEHAKNLEVGVATKANEC